MCSSVRSTQSRVRHQEPGRLNLSALLLFNTLWLSKARIGYLPMLPVLPTLRQENRTISVRISVTISAHKKSLCVAFSRVRCGQLRKRPSENRTQGISDNGGNTFILIAIVTPEMYNQKVSFYYLCTFYHDTSHSSSEQKMKPRKWTR